MIASNIRQELMQIIMHELDDPRLSGLPSITRIKVATDLSVADVYVTVMGTDAKQLTALNALRHSAGMMRTKLIKTLPMRTVPYLKFHLDEKLKKELEVLDLIEKAARELPPLEVDAATDGATAPADDAGRAARIAAGLGVVEVTGSETPESPQPFDSPAKSATAGADVVAEGVAASATGSADATDIVDSTDAHAPPPAGIFSRTSAPSSPGAPASAAPAESAPAKSAPAKGAQQSAEPAVNDSQVFESAPAPAAGPGQAPTAETDE